MGSQVYLKGKVSCPLKAYLIAGACPDLKSPLLSDKRDRLARVLGYGSCLENRNARYRPPDLLLPFLNKFTEKPWKISDDSRMQVRIVADELAGVRPGWSYPSKARHARTNRHAVDNPDEECEGKECVEQIWRAKVPAFGRR